MREGTDKRSGWRLEYTDLLQAVAEQLKTPLTIIARQSELALAVRGTASGSQDIFSIVQTQSEVALKLLDGYLLGLQLADEQAALALEPVSIAALLADTAYDLHELAKQSGVAIEVEVAGRYEPVMAHARGLRAALISVGYSFVEACAAAPAPARRELTLAVHRTSHGIVAGCYGDFELLAAQQWRQALELCGRARQPLSNLCTGTGAGLFVADTLCAAMETGLRVGRFHKQTGLAVTFQPSRQLQLV